MSLKSYLFRKKMERHFEREKVPLNQRYGGLKAMLRSFYAWRIKPLIQSFIHKSKFISRMPLSISVTAFLLFCFLVMAMFSQIIYQRWANDVINAQPELVQGTIDPETGRVMPSPLDAIMIPFVAKGAGMDFLMFNTTITLFLLFVWKMHNPRKPQSFHFRGLK